MPAGSPSASAHRLRPPAGIVTDPEAKLTMPRDTVGTFADPLTMRAHVVIARADFAMNPETFWRCPETLLRHLRMR